MASQQQPVSSKDDGEHGFALVFVISIAVLLALLAAVFLAAVRVQIRSVSDAKEVARAEAVADAGANLALADLVAWRIDPTRSSRFSAGGTPIVCAVDADSTVIVQVFDEAGKVDLNTPNADLLLALFVGRGAVEEDAKTYVDRILDFRDGDDEVRTKGAETDNYIVADQMAPPKNNTFDTPEELGQVLGIPQNVVLDVLPFITTYSRLSGVDPAIASRALADALSAASDIAGGGIATGDESGFLGQKLPPRFVSRSPARAFTILATAQMASGARFARKVVVEFERARGALFALREWRREVNIPPEAIAAGTGGKLPSC